MISKSIQGVRFPSTVPLGWDLSTWKSLVTPQRTSLQSCPSCQVASVSPGKLLISTWYKQIWSWEKQEPWVIIGSYWFTNLPKAWWVTFPWWSRPPSSPSADYGGLKFMSRDDPHLGLSEAGVSQESPATFFWSNPGLIWVMYPIKSRYFVAHTYISHHFPSFPIISHHFPFVLAKSNPIFHMHNLVTSFYAALP